MNQIVQKLFISQILNEEIKNHVFLSNEMGNIVSSKDKTNELAHLLNPLRRIVSSNERSFVEKQTG